LTLLIWWMCLGPGNASTAVTWEAGPWIEIDLAYSETISMNADQVLRIRVKQEQGDAIIRLLDSKGNLLALQDNFSDHHDVELLCFHAVESGNLILEVQHEGSGAGRAFLSLQVDELREMDRIFLEAQAGFESAQSKKDLSAEQRVQRFSESAMAFSKLGFHELASKVWLRAGLAHYRQGNLSKALDAHRKALLELDEPSQPKKAIHLYSNIGVFLRKLGRPFEALKNYEKALELTKQKGFDSLHARVQNNLGIVNHMLNQNEEALVHFQAALDFFFSKDMHRYAARTLNNYAVSLLALYEYDLAERHFLQALEQLEKQPNPSIQIFTLTNLGDLYQRQGKWKTAWRVFQEAVEVANATEEPQGLVNLQNNLGYLCVQQGDYSQAMALEDRALELCGGESDLRGEMFAHLIKGVAALNLNRFELAQHEMNLALAQARDLQALDVMSGVHHQLARLYHQQNQQENALRHVQKATELVSMRQQRLGGSEFRSLFWQNVQDVFRFQLELLAEQYLAGPTPVLAERMANVFEQTRAQALLDQILNCEADQRPDADLDAAFQRRELLAELERLEVQRLVQQEAGQPEDELETKIKSKLLQIKELDIKVLNPNLAPERTPRNAFTFAEIQTQLLDQDHTLLMLCPLPEKLLAWIITPDQCHLEVVPIPVDFGLKVVKAMNRIQQETDLDAVYEELQALSACVLQPCLKWVKGKRLVLVTADYLQQIPFAALPCSSKGREDLCVDRFELASVPSISVYRALRAKKARSGNQIAIWADPVFAGSDYRLNAGLKQVKHAETPDSAPRWRAGDFASKTSEDLGFERLRASRAEAKAIQGLMVDPQQTKLLLDFKATRQSVLETSLGQFDVLHFATHGVVNTNHPELSGLVFSLFDESGAQQDGFLRLHDIYNLKLKAQLVVLSSCQSAQGKQVEGEGLKGLSQAFIAAGAKGVLATLWDTSDAASLKLMASFYEARMKSQMKNPAALRKAQVELKRMPRFQHPKYWAPFQYQGAW